MRGSPNSSTTPSSPNCAGGGATIGPCPLSSPTIPIPRPSAVSSHNLTIIVAWVSSNFLQLVLLPIIIVGQNIQAKAADARAEATYKDADAVLHEAIEIQKHLEAQDRAIERILAGVTSDGPTPPPAAAG